jgi:hypothetical protein
VSEDVTRWQTFTVDFACYVASVTGTFYWQRVANAFQVSFATILGLFCHYIRSLLPPSTGSVSPMPIRY